MAIAILRLKLQACLPSGESEQLAVGDQALTIRSSSTAERDHSITSCSSRVEVETSLCQAADDQGRIGLVIMDSCGNEVELLVYGAVARLENNGDQVCSEVAGRWVDE